MADQVLYEVSNSVEKSETPFIKRSTISVIDQNNGSYTSQIQFDLGQIANNSGYCAWSESYITVPIVLGYFASSTADVNEDISDATSPFVLGIKNGYYNIIDQLQVTYNSKTVVQQSPYLNVYTTFKILSSWTEQYANKYGPSIGWVKDDALSVGYNTGGSLNGNGVFNNNIAYNNTTGNSASLMTFQSLVYPPFPLILDY